MIRRYLKNETGTLAIVNVGSDGHLSWATNTLLLSDPEDPRSAPAAGWVEITANKYEKLARAREEASRAKVEDQLADRAADRRLAYEEALDLGFSPRSAATMSGYTPAE